MGRTLKLALSFVATGLLAGGCAEDPPEIAITFNQPFSDECSPPAARGGTGFVYRSRGTLELFVTDSYLMAPRLESRLVPTTGVSVGTAGGGGGGVTGADWEANDVSLTRAIIEYDVPDAVNVPIQGRLIREVSGSITPGGVASLSLEAIPASVGVLLRTSDLLRVRRVPVTMNLRIRYEGVTFGGREVTSNEFIYPIELCYGCLLYFPPNAIDREYPVLPNCRLLSEEEESLCLPGQDEPIDCRQICPYVTAIPGGDPEGICEPTSTF